MKAINCPRLAGFDTPRNITAEAAAKFLAARYSFAMRYLTRWPTFNETPKPALGKWFYPLSRQELAECTGAGLPVGVVQAADTKDDPGNPWDDITADGGRRLGASAVEQLEFLDAPKGITVFFDAEYSPTPDPLALIAAIESWAVELNGAGFRGGMYYGPGTGLTAEQAWQLIGITRYWRGAAIVPFPNNRGINMQQGCETELFGYDIDQNLACYDGHPNHPGRFKVIAA